MKKIITVLSLSAVALLPVVPASAQTPELTQLALNIEKLAELKKILQTMKEYYDILTQGYNAVRDLARGNFSIHKVFLDGLLEVSPTVKKYHRIVDIVDLQLQLVKEYKLAFNRIKGSSLLNEGELDYIRRVYGQLVDRTMDNLDDLITVTTAGKLRMSDDERIATIDTIWSEMKDKLTFLRYFNNQTGILLLQRSREKADAQGLQKITGINK